MSKHIARLSSSEIIGVLACKRAAFINPKNILLTLLEPDSAHRPLLYGDEMQTKVMTVAANLIIERNPSLSAELGVEPLKIREWTTDAVAKSRRSANNTNELELDMTGISALVTAYKPSKRTKRKSEVVPAESGQTR